MSAAAGSAAAAAPPAAKPLDAKGIWPGDILISDEAVLVSHSAVCVEDDKIAHAMGGVPLLGSLLDFEKGKGTVYRANPNLTYPDTANLWRVCQALAPKMKFGTNYATLVFGSAEYGAGAAAWKASMQEMYINGVFATKSDQGKPANLVCSQFVVLAMQIALGEKHVSFIKLDGRYTLPKTLRSYLVGAGSGWRAVGPYNRGVFQYGVPT
ncbi:hypothetical protein [Plastoroseomonas arctica]|uniref:Uncharacterized protein n=1 Tax=Plastoroseomonas arctica TaxID=1509237 RepID=A0AAF1JXQ3_9PROT|nr:hypothetical protein [Plastoroseomonas arctica]MBR0656416.1 hypothetical protein [Plastoroseomonas arctica]